MNSVQNPAYLASLEARFAIAERHSRLVRMLRIALPAAVVLALAAVLAISIFNPFRMLVPKLPLDIGNLVISGTKVTMESPHLSGYTPDNRPYDLWATTATQDVTDPDRVELKTLRAKVLMEDQSTVTLHARTGLFDNRQQTLDLHKDIVLNSTSGYQAYLSQAFVNLAKGSMESDKHVDVKLPNGTLSADGLKITGGGEVVRFEGHVVMNLDHLNVDHPPSGASEASTQPALAEAGPPVRGVGSRAGRSTRSK